MEDSLLFLVVDDLVFNSMWRVFFVPYAVMRNVLVSLVNFKAHWPASFNRGLLVLVLGERKWPMKNLLKYG